MGVADLLTLAQAQAARAGKPNWKSPITRLDEKTAAKRDDAKLLETWKRKVRYRDRGHCRVCKIKTVTTLALDPKRGEAHHIVSRTCPAVRYDVRNGLHVCAKCHSLLTRHKLFVVGTAAQMFTAGDQKTKSYLNGSEPDLRFVERKPA